METVNYRGFDLEIKNEDENYYDCAISSDIAEKVKAENPCEYLQWEDGSEIHTSKLQNFLIHIPKPGTSDKVSISYIIEDFWIEDIIFEKNKS